MHSEKFGEFQKTRTQKNVVLAMLNRSIASTITKNLFPQWHLPPSKM